MPQLAARGHLRGISLALAVISAAALLVNLPPAAVAAAPSAEPEGSGRLHTITFNICDQYRTGKETCTDDTPHERAVYIENIMLAADYLPQVGMFQEICYSTYHEAKELLGSAYRGDFRSTQNRPLQCGAGNEGKWGLAYIVKGPLTRESALPLPDDEDEGRILFCGKTTIYTTFRVCTTHLTPVGVNPTPVQVNALGNYMRNWASINSAVIVGGDMNLNARWGLCDPHPCCPPNDWVNRLKPLYYGLFGKGVAACGAGTNYYYEGDNYRAGTPVPHDENTVVGENQKLDYVFFNYQRFNSDYGADAMPPSSLSDHVYLRASMTVHD